MNEPELNVKTLRDLRVIFPSLSPEDLCNLTQLRDRDDLAKAVGGRFEGNQDFIKGRFWAKDDTLKLAALVRAFNCVDLGEIADICQERSPENHDDFIEITLTFPETPVADVLKQVSEPKFKDAQDCRYVALALSNIWQDIDINTIVALARTDGLSPRAVKALHGLLPGVEPAQIIEWAANPRLNVNTEWAANPDLNPENVKALRELFPAANPAEIIEWAAVLGLNLENVKVLRALFPDLHPDDFVRLGAQRRDLSQEKGRALKEIFPDASIYALIGTLEKYGNLGRDLDLDTLWDLKKFFPDACLEDISIWISPLSGGAVKMDTLRALKNIFPDASPEDAFRALKGLGDLPLDELRGLKGVFPETGILALVDARIFYGKHDLSRLKKFRDLVSWDYRNPEYVTNIFGVSKLISEQNLEAFLSLQKIFSDANILTLAKIVSKNPNLDMEKAKDLRDRNPGCDFDPLRLLDILADCLQES